jgi:hypothetical protein
MRKVIARSVCVCSLIICSFSSVQAALVTAPGIDIQFTYDDSTLFGTGTVVGNSIFFLPTNFLAESYDGAGLDTAAQTLTIDVELIDSESTFVMTDFHMLEDGDYRLRGAGADVDASGMFAVTSASGETCGFFACRDTSFFNAGPLVDTGGALAAWSASDDIFLSWGSDTSVALTLQNDLLAETTSDGEIAFIQKKFGAIGVSVNEEVPPAPTIPVPPAVWLFGSGLLGLIGIARRKKTA